MPVGVDPEQTEFDEVEKIGGTKSVTLNISEIPSHSHAPAERARFVEYDNTTSQETVGEISGSGWNIRQTTGSTGASTTTANTGGGGSHNNLQPYIACYFWKRTA